MRRLPPLRALEAFVRTVNLGSAKAAAADLAISAPALSRRLKSLEDFIGKPLFDRKAQTMTPNAEAERLAAEARVLKKNRQHQKAHDLYSQAIELDRFNHGGYFIMTK